MDKPRIGRYADDPNLYTFARTSNLPRDYFFVSQRVERIGGAGWWRDERLAVFISFGLALGWFA
jgi:hypothetical protein